MWSAIGSILSAILSAVLTTLATALKGKRQDEDRVKTHEEAAVADAAEETADVISEMADDRAAAASSAGIDGFDASNLASSLRNRKASSGGSHPNS
jgi:hypothetical protein